MPYGKGADFTLRTTLRATLTHPYMHVPKDKTHLEFKSEAKLPSPMNFYLEGRTIFVIAQDANVKVRKKI